MSHIRIESHQKVVTGARVFFVNGDEEVDISSCVQVVDVHLGVGEVATATLRTITGHASVTAKIDEIINSHVRPSVWRRLTRRGWREVASISDRWRRA